MTRVSPPNPKQFRDTAKWAEQMYEFMLTQTRVGEINDPAPVLLAGNLPGSLARASVDGILMFDPVAQRPLVSIGGEFLPLATQDDVPDLYYGHLQADYTLTNTTAVQKLFNWSANGALTLPTGVYRFRAMVYLTTMSATSGNGSFRLKGGGTATLARILYHVTGIDNTSPLNAGTQTGSAAIVENSAASMVSAGTGTGLTAIIEGFFDVTVTGTIIPSIALVTAAAAVVKAGSFFECERVGDTATAASSGWS